MLTLIFMSIGRTGAKKEGQKGRMEEIKEGSKGRMLERMKMEGRK